MLLDALVAVFQDGGQARQEVADGRLHPLCDGGRVDPAAARSAIDDGDDGAQSPEDRRQDVGELLAEVLEEDDAEVREELVLAARGLVL